ncbi:Gfo/Idh/MocA family oxidoreductase [Dongia mobilis]|uniref:Gfo/Idh/MocA family oxidoreductase n=1 Tax=Dongia mobilis TaxID=578943 RepID=UPI0010613282|nr:Gfo/Idh/MocA family oxidoreductase [Dongia mobilis]
MGLSPGNGHPYSWAAICNGYDAVAMKHCPFPAIPAYLAERRFPDDRIPDVEVTHIWTQDNSASRGIAAASLIPHVVADPAEMIGAVDAILLARDDAPNHYQLAAPFLEAGLPVYIDKPLALTRTAAHRLLDLEKYPGQIFTGTPLTYCAEFQLDQRRREQIGEIGHISAVTPKYWGTYAVHVIEPALALLGTFEAPVQHKLAVAGSRHMLSVAWASGQSAQFLATGSLAAPLALHVFGARGHAVLEFRDSFSAFKTAIMRFLEGIRSRRRMFDRDLCLAGARLIELGNAKD